MSHAVVAVLTAVACVLLLLGAAFQVALAAGAPLAAAAYGGRAAQPDGRLPLGHRITSAITAIVLLGIGSLLLLHGGMLGAAHPDAPVVRVGVWVVAGLFALNTAGNLAGRHPLERWGMGGLTASLTVLSRAARHRRLAPRSGGPAPSAGRRAVCRRPIGASSCTPHRILQNTQVAPSMGRPRAHGVAE